MSIKQRPASEVLQNFLQKFSRISDELLDIHQELESVSRVFCPSIDDIKVSKLLRRVSEWRAAHKAEIKKALKDLDINPLSVKDGTKNADEKSMKEAIAKERHYIEKVESLKKKNQQMVPSASQIQKLKRNEEKLAMATAAKNSLVNPATRSSMSSTEIEDKIDECVCLSERLWPSSRIKPMEINETQSLSPPDISGPITGNFGSSRISTAKFIAEEQPEKSKHFPDESRISKAKFVLEEQPEKSKNQKKSPSVDDSRIPRAKIAAEEQPEKSKHRKKASVQSDKDDSLCPHAEGCGVFWNL
eukprot:GHVP01064866.1.p2 GENE.GHVP01064866.1~~GHVP01064866.1.p2  ORF type:complete len:302 (+),score=80.40 GHVP01064866.1:2423-3328(+)